MQEKVFLKPNAPSSRNGNCWHLREHKIYAFPCYSRLYTIFSLYIWSVYTLSLSIPSTPTITLDCKQWIYTFLQSLLTMHFGTILSNHLFISNNFASANLWKSCEYSSVILAFAEPVIILWSGMDSQGISHSSPTSMSALLITSY